MDPDEIRIPAERTKIRGAVDEGEREARAEGEEDRLVRLSFSSDAPVEMYGDWEILGHEPGEVDSEWIASGRAPFLVDHKRSVDSQIGVIESAIFSDGRGRAVVRFGTSAKAREMLARVRDNELSAISVGYRIERAVYAGKQDGRDVIRVTRWKPVEISLVSAPADESVGIGRSAPGGGEIIIRRESEMDNEKEAAAAAKEAERAAAQARREASAEEAQRAAADKARSEERARVAAIHATAARFNISAEKRDKAIGDGITAEAFNGIVLESMGDGAQERLNGAARIGMSEREERDFSFLRLGRALLAARKGERDAWKEAGLERAATEAQAAALGREAAGAFLPADVLMRREGRRDLNVGTATAGGNLVAIDLLASSFIDLLRARSILPRLGASTLFNLTGNLSIPRQTGGAAAYWVGEGGAPTEGQAAFDQVPMTPKTLGAYTEITRRLLLQSSLDIESLVRRDLAASVALAWDKTALMGDADADAPDGLVDVAAVLDLDLAAANPTWAEYVQMESLVAAENADVGTLAYALNPAQRGAAKTTEKASGTAQFIWDDGEINGYRAEVSNQVTAGNVFYGNWADLLIGAWSGMDFNIDDKSLSTSGGLRIVLLTDVDIAVRQPKSFVHARVIP